MELPDASAIETHSAALQACVDHASDLLEAARAVLAIGKHNIAYHLATLALEEIGRRELLAMQFVSSRGPTPPAWPIKHQTNHYQKLFWAFLGADFLATVTTPQNVEELRDIAKTIHETRLAGLYVDAEGDTIGIPREAIAPEEADHLLRLAEARLGMVSTQTFRDSIPAEDLQLIAWFQSITENPDWRKIIFSKTSMEKLGSMGDSRAWIAWVKEQYDAATATIAESVEVEIERGKSKMGPRTRDKWSMKFRVLSATHVVSPRTLTPWNKHVPNIQLGMPDPKKRNEITVDLLLGNDVPVQGIFWWGDANARQFIVALNIATRGFWWMRLPEHPGRYYDSLIDLDTGHGVILQRDEFTLPWGANNVLKDADLAVVLRCLLVIRELAKKDATRIALDKYISGLSFLSLTEVNQPFDTDAFYAFTDGLRDLMKTAGEQREFEVALREFVAASIANVSVPEDPENYVRLATLPESERGKQGRVKVTYIALAKLIFDLYFFLVVGPRHSELWTGNGESASEQSPPP